MPNPLLSIDHPGFSPLPASARSRQGTAIAVHARHPTLVGDRRGEQPCLTAYERIIFPSPFSAEDGPPLLKKWRDIIPEQGRAQGRPGSPSGIPARCMGTPCLPVFFRKGVRDIDGQKQAASAGVPQDEGETR